MLLLFAVPLYVHFIGIEAFGVIGLFVSFSALIGFLDLGMGATLTRELARLAAGPNALPMGRDTLRTFETVYAMMALLIGFVGFLASRPLAASWLKIESLDQFEIAAALALAGVALACQWPTNLYTAGLAGIHRHVTLGLMTIVFSTVRVVTTVGALWVSPSLTTFFSAQIFASILQTLGFRWLLWRALEQPAHVALPRFAILRSTFRFAGGMTLIAMTSVLLTQTDKIILSKILSLSNFGIYALAGALASGLYMLVSPMFLVIFPRFSALVHQAADADLTNLYRMSSQLMALLVIPAAAVLAGLSEHALYAWTGDAKLSSDGKWILALLIFGNACNGLMNIPYALQLAAGWTKLALWVNSVTLAFLLPLIWWAASTYGAIGGAAVWALVNVIHIVFTPYIMHKRLLPREMTKWYRDAIIAPFAACSTVVFVFAQLPISTTSRPFNVVVLLSCWLLGVAATLMVLPRLRKQAKTLLCAQLRRA